MGPMFTCSIDDGHPLDMRAAELLNKHGLHGTFFIPIRNREGHEVLANAEIREIGRRFEVGSHTYDHCYLKHIDIWRAYHQVAAGKKQLEDLLGQEVTGFCYPGGCYQKRDVELVRSCGFHYARTTVNLRFDAGDKPHEMPTTIQFYPHGRGVYLRNFAVSGSWLQRHDGLRLALQHHDWIERLRAMFDHACERNATFHLWAHSAQIEELNAWQAFDTLLGHIASNIVAHNRVTNEHLAMRAFAAPLQPAVGSL